MAGYKQTLCPYCFRYFEPWQAHWKCINPGCDKNGEIDPVYEAYRAEFLQGSAPVPGAHTFELPAPTPWRQRLGTYTLVKHTRCPECNGDTDIKLCPHCHNEMDFDVGEEECQIIAIVGSKGSTKSHYIAVLVEELKRLGSAYGFSIGYQGDETERQYRTNYYEPLYVQKRALRVTQVSIDQPPMIFQLRFDSARMGKNKTITLVFYDVSGELFEDQVSMNLRTRYLTHASALILLMDPLQIPPLRTRLEQHGYTLPPRSADPDVILQRVIRQLRRYGDLPQSRKIPKPLAVAFTKSDVLLRTGLLAHGNAVYGTPRHREYFDENVFRQVDEEVKDLLKDLYNESVSLDKRLEQNYQHSAFFCLSPLGGEPVPPAMTIETLAPWRVEDPVLWALYKLGYIKMEAR